jgi:hypothetical protein
MPAIFMGFKSDFIIIVYKIKFAKLILPMRVTLEKDFFADKFFLIKKNNNNEYHPI